MSDRQHGPRSSSQTSAVAGGERRPKTVRMSIDRITLRGFTTEQRTEVSNSLARVLARKLADPAIASSLENRAAPRVSSSVAFSGRAGDSVSEALADRILRILVGAP